MAAEQTEREAGAVLQTGHVEPNVSDLEGSERFYVRVFGRLDGSA